MAGSRIKGLTIEIDGNTTKLTDSLKGVDKSLKDTQSQLKDVNKLLKLDPSNVELLKQKQELLKKAVEDTKKRQEELKTALEQAKNAGDTAENRKQQDLLQRELIETTQKLEGLEKEYKQCSPTLEAVSAKTGELADKTKTMSMVAGAAAAGMVYMAGSAASSADDLMTLSRNTGLSVEELQKLQYAAPFVDVSFETMTGSIQKLTKKMGEGSEAFDELGIVIHNSDGSLRSAKEVWYEAIEALGEIQNETERDTIAMELFGKSATEMAGIVDDGGEALRTLGQEAEDMGAIISQEDLDKANELNDTLDKLKAEVLPQISQFGVEIAEMILPYLPQIKEAIQEILDVLKELDPQTVAIVGGILAITSALSPLLSIISGIASAISILAKVPGAISSIGAAASKVAPALSTAWGAISSFFTADIASTMAAGGVAAVGTAFTAIVGAITAFFGGAELGKKIGAWLFPDDKELYESYSGITGTLNMLKDFFIALKDLFIMKWEETVKVGKYWINEFKDAFVTAMNFVKDTWLTSWNAMKSTFMNIINSIKSTFTDMINGIIDKLNTASSKISSWTHGAVNLGSFKFMAEGGVLTSGSAIVGEAGPEFVQVSNGQAMVQPLSGHSDLAGLLETYLPYLAAGTQLVMDSGALVGSIAPDMNMALGTMAIRGGRR